MFRSETGADGAMYSCHVASDQSEYHRFIIYRDATSGANVSMNISPIGNDATFLLRHAFRLENGLVTWGNESYDFGTTAKDCANELYLFGSKDYNFESYYMTVYSWKIYESDNGKKGGANQTLVHDFVPALDSDGVPGLYDTVSHKFYPSITGTDFVYYQPGSLPADYTRLEYIESTVDGQQYIDVPYVKYVNDGPTKITMRGMYTTSASDYQTLCGFTTEGFCCLGIKQGTDCVGNDSIGQDIKLAKNSLDTISWELDPLNSGNGAKKEWLAVNSAVNGEASDTGTSLLVLSGTNLTIFATYAKASHEMMYFSNYKLYAMTVEQGGVVVADFVPALNSSGVPGLYDLATGQFLTNDGSGEFGYEKVSQWFRLTVTKKSGGVDDGFNIAEFALYDRAGNRQNLNLANAGSLAVLAPGQFYHDKKGGTTWGDGASERAFDGDRSTKLGLTLAPGTYTSSGEITDPQVLTMRLTNGAPEVVKYNLCSASDADNYKQRMPTAWTLEKSYDGVNWVVVDRQDETTSGWTTVNSTWYRDGGSGNEPESYFSFGDWGKEATQWFRLTIQKKLDKNGNADSDKSLQLSEFALYDANGVRQNLNLAIGASADALWPGEFYYHSTQPVVFWTNEHPIKMFDGELTTKMGVDNSKSDLTKLCDGDEDCWQVLTMRLTNGAPEVVKYNMCSGGDTSTYKTRAPTAWTLERSTDGVNWVVCDVQVQTASNWTTQVRTWYNGGGTAVSPSTYYGMSRSPLPKPSRVYEYTGQAITPTFEPAWARDSYELSGDTSATEVGVYTVICTPKEGCAWENGSTGPYEVKWEIARQQTFLERLAADPRRVNGEGVVNYDTGLATGGDLVFFDKEDGAYIHIFTNTAEEATFTAKQNLYAELLIVGGGGGGGGSRGGTGTGGGGGGAGGMVSVGLQRMEVGDYRVKVGDGGQGGDEQHDCLNGGSTFLKTSLGMVMYEAFGGGRAGWSARELINVQGKTESSSGAAGGSGGGHAALWEGTVRAPALDNGSQGHAGGLSSKGSGSSTSAVSGGGGGGAGEDGGNGVGASGGKGGDGLPSTILGQEEWFAGGGAGSFNNQRSSTEVPAAGGLGGGGSALWMYQEGGKWVNPCSGMGSDGQGGGGAGGTGFYQGGQSGGRGGSGIVIIRYAAPRPIAVAVPTANEGLVYNGMTQVGVSEGVGYTLSDYYSTTAGIFTATATLLAGYEWADGSTAALTLSWRIDPAPITGVRLVAKESQYQSGVAHTPVVESVTTASGLTVTDANCGWDFVRYERNRQATEDLESVGYVSVVVQGKGNLTGTKAAAFRIYEAGKVPLPRLTQTRYEYTGSTITPTFEPEPSDATYTLSGVTGTNEIGVYTVKCTLAAGCSWENGSTGPYEVTWEIVRKQTFLEKLASDPRRVNGDGAIGYDTGFAAGGDIVLFDPKGSAYIHVFTNTASAATFTAKQNLDAWVLAIGGGGGGGSTNGGGGGAGGMIEDECLPLAQGQDISITVGCGASGVTSGHGETGSQTKIVVPDLDPIIAYGGGGGGSVYYANVPVVTDDIRARIDGHGGENVGSGGGAAGYFRDTNNPSGSGTPGRSITMYKGVKQGYDGGAANIYRSCPAGGGGGAGTVGETSGCHDNWGGRHGGGRANVGGYGGDGRRSDILGFSQYFAGGGASGGNDWGSGVAVGGVGGGGNGAGYVKKDETDESVPKAQAGENGLGGGGGGGKGGDVNPLYNPGAAGGDGIVIIRYMATPPIEVAVPTAKTGLFYNGNTQVGVPESFAYALSGHYATEAGKYTATATLNHGYMWADSTGEADLTRTIEWEIVEPGYTLRVIRDTEDAPTIWVPETWLQTAFPDAPETQEGYQSAFLAVNGSGVKAWQAYVLGFGASEVSTAAILEETAQNANPETVTIRLRGMPETPRTNETASLAYSLYAARTPEGLANGGGTVVTNKSECADGYYKWHKSTFEAPLDDLTEAEPVNYYRVKVHFIFDK